jgi:L-ribulose-5-phosphate 4-epimerase
MLLEQLRVEVCAANKDLARHELIKFTWGNVSGIDRAQGLFVIKPSGVPYDQLTPEHMVVLDLQGKVVEGSLRPSSDAPTHAVLYSRFATIGGVAHTHSPHATIFAQACRTIPCLGTTHADHFNGEIPVTRPLRRTEIERDYESFTGIIIADHFSRMDPLQMPAVLVANHGPFTWGRSAHDAVVNSVVLEEVARMAQGTLALNPNQPTISPHLLDKHFHRKHGPGATYGQK